MGGIKRVSAGGAVPGGIRIIGATENNACGDGKEEVFAANIIVTSAGDIFAKMLVQIGDDFAGFWCAFAVVGLGISSVGGFTNIRHG